MLIKSGGGNDGGTRFRDKRDSLIMSSETEQPGQEPNPETKVYLIRVVKSPLSVESFPMCGVGVTFEVRSDREYFGFQSRRVDPRVILGVP